MAKRARTYRPAQERGGTERQPHDPTEEEIAARMAEVQANWTDRDREDRRYNKGGIGAYRGQSLNRQHRSGLIPVVKSSDLIGP